MIQAQEIRQQRETITMWNHCHDFSGGLAETIFSARGSVDILNTRVRHRYPSLAEEAISGRVFLFSRALLEKRSLKFSPVSAPATVLGTTFRTSCSFVSTKRHVRKVSATKNFVLVCPYKIGGKLVPSLTDDFFLHTKKQAVLFECKTHSEKCCTSF